MHERKNRNNSKSAKKKRLAKDNDQENAEQESDSESSSDDGRTKRVYTTKERQVRPFTTSIDDIKANMVAAQGPSFWKECCRQTIQQTQYAEDRKRDSVRENELREQDKEDREQAKLDRDQQRMFMQMMLGFAKPAAANAAQ